MAIEMDLCNQPQLEMIDTHVHFLHGGEGGYTDALYQRFIERAREMQLDELYLLEHTHQFKEFSLVYEPVRRFNAYQDEWISRKMASSVEDYLAFIEKARQISCPVKVKFGLEVCYIPEREDRLASVLDQYDFDFLTGSVHWIDGWGFDHSRQCETWQGVSVDKVYRRYYQIMADLVESGLFTGLAHPDSIRCFGHHPGEDLSAVYRELAALLAKFGMYAENSGGLALNYGFPELGMNRKMLRIFKDCEVRVLPASDAHKPEDTGMNIRELLDMI